MHHSCCIGTNFNKKDTLESLQKEYDYIKEDMDKINKMQVSQKAKDPILKELREQIDDVKERMHNVIDEM